MRSYRHKIHAILFTKAIQTSYQGKYSRTYLPCKHSGWKIIYFITNKWVSHSQIIQIILWPFLHLNTNTCKLSLLDSHKILLLVNLHIIFEKLTTLLFHSSAAAKAVLNSSPSFGTFPLTQVQVARYSFAEG